jgi:gamma-glutamylaminecyclotransferase
MLVLVTGSALREISGDQARFGMTFIEEARTAPKYRLYALEGRWAALLEVESGGIAVEGELVEIADDRWAEVAASEPPGIEPGPVELEDGRLVTAALGDPEHLRVHGEDITELGSFPAYVRSRA